MSGSVDVSQTTERIPFNIRHPVRWLAQIAICSTFLSHAVVRFLNFDLAIAEIERLGLLPASPIAAAAIAVEVICSLLIVSGFLRWIGALTLGGFMVITTVLTQPVWAIKPGVDRIMATDAFMLHLGVAGGLLLIAWYDLHIWRIRGSD
ncbi:DoxX family protein [Pararhizobium sp. PWRC1-1]|uniref:DoxX family protein n=1 Tax=Pararhizobium sp. PWRC1-1 TaxID=2804566 RepID=UPI003CEA7C57